MTGPLIDALLAEQARQQAALERMLRTVARWAGLTDGAGGDNGAEHRSPSDVHAPAPVAPAGQETGLQVGPPRSSGTAPPPARPRTAGPSAQVLERRAITPARPAGSECVKGWQDDLPPARPALAVSSAADRSRAENSSNAEPPRARLRALANGPADPRTRVPSPGPLRETTALRRARLTPLGLHVADRAPSAVPHPHSAMARSDDRAGPPAPSPRDTPDRMVAWDRTLRVQAMTAAPSLAPAPSPPSDAVSWPEPAPHRMPEATQPAPVDRHRLDPFPESTLEEAIADALERAVLEAGIDLT